MSEKTYVGLVQISEKRDHSHYIPYSIGLLQAYAQKNLSHPERFEFLPFIYSRQLIPEVLDALGSADIVGFSVYIWNIKRSLAIAQALKTSNPDIVIVFGGPQVPKDTVLFLEEHSFIDLCCVHEGEVLFTEVLERLETQDWEQIPGLRYRDRGGYKANSLPPRIKDLDRLPSPYLSGVFDTILPLEKHWIAVWETNRGCPFSCSFCDWGAALQSKVYRFDMARIESEINWFSDQQIHDVFCADANFGILKRDIEIAEAYAMVKKNTGFPKSLQTQTAKNLTQRIYRIQSILNEAKLNTIAAISLQSLNQKTLAAIERSNISNQKYQDLQEYCLDHDIYTYTDLIIGLPEESYESYAQGISDTLHWGQHNKVLFQNAAILPNAEMGNPEYLKRHVIQTVEIPFPGQSLMPDQIQETLQIIVSTATLSRHDWVKCMVLSWLTNFLHYTNKLLQVVLITLKEYLKVSYKTILEWFINPQYTKAYPLLYALITALYQTAQLLQEGKAEHSNNPLLFSREQKITHLSPDISLQLRLVNERKIASFFESVYAFFQSRILDLKMGCPPDLLQEAFWVSRIVFTQCFFKRGYAPERLPELSYPETLELQWNIPEFYNAVKVGHPITLKREPGVIKTASLATVL